MRETEKTYQIRSNDEEAYNALMREHADQMRFENFSDSVHEMMRTLVEAGYVSETGNAIS